VWRAAGAAADCRCRVVGVKMSGDDIWPRVLAQVYATYATDGAGISENKLAKHTVKAAGKMGMPGTKHARTKLFQDYMAAARCRLLNPPSATHAREV